MSLKNRTTFLEEIYLTDYFNHKQYIQWHIIMS